MNHRGETRELAAIAQPTIAVVNNAQREHQEFMASVDEVAAEHADAILALRPRGTAVHQRRRRARGRVARGGARAGAAVVDFGFDDWADVSARCTLRADGSDIELRTYAGNARVELHVPGRHMASNALAATAAALAARLPLSAIERGLAAFRPVAGRLSALHAASGALVIDDTYNANPDSVRAAIDVLAHAPGAKWLVLGDMGEVGAQGPAFHREIGAYAQGARRRAAVRDRRARPRDGGRVRRGRRARGHGRGARAARAARGHRRRHAAGQGLALDADGAGRGGAHRPGSAGVALMLVLLAERLEQYVRAFNVFGYITLRAVLATMTALVISFVVGPRMIAWLARMKIGQSVRDDGPQTHLAKAGTPTMGGALILVSIVGHHAAVGQPHQSLRLGRAARDRRLRRRRLGRRLAQGRAPQSQGPVGAHEVLLAVGDRPRRRRLSRLFGVGARQHAVRPAPVGVGGQRLQRRPVAEGRPHRAVLQDHVLSARRVGLHRAHVTSSSSAPATRST